MFYSRYYRNQLSVEEQIVYDILLDGIEKYKSSIVSPLFSKSSLNKIVFAVNFDNPSIFYVDFSLIKTVFYPSSCSISVQYIYSYEKIDRIKQKLNKAVENILSQIKYENPKDYLLWLHDWIVTNCTYGEITKRPYASHRITGCLFDHICVCEGYSKTFQYLCECLQIKCITVVGDAYHPDGTHGGHAWNIVKRENSLYHVDVTFDNLIAGKYCSHAYYLLSTRQIQYDHTIDKLISVPNCTESGNKLKLVGGTSELISYLKEEAKKGVSYSEVRLTKGFIMVDLMSMIKDKLSITDLVWYNKIKSYIYGEKSKTLIILWS